MNLPVVFIFFYFTLFFQSAFTLPAGNGEKNTSSKLPRIATRIKETFSKPSNMPDTPKSPLDSWDFHHQDRMMHHARMAEDTAGKEKKHHINRSQHHQTKLIDLRVNEAKKSLANAEKKIKASSTE